MGGVPRKIHILRFIIEQRVVTLDDIHGYLGSENHTDSIRVTLYQIGASHIKYGKLPNGVWYVNDSKSIELLKAYHRDFPWLCTRRIPLHFIPHALGINRIRIILEQTPCFKIDAWWSETYIRALTPRMRFGISLAKIPDAIFWRLRSDGSRQKFFLEYERTLKSKSRYLELFQYYANRNDVINRNVLYICENETIKEELERIEEFLVKSGKLESSGLYFQFITLDGFCQQYLSLIKQKGETKCENLINT
ncbi:MAG: replication-relaxation family protein [Candidatus Omnitrophica bacterium]|nr:replication-relaxation family protein [Candidatus Omnitrophota bacterium]